MTNRLATAVSNRQQVNVSTPPIPRGPGLSIKGAAGPFVVEASNFAPGTTAADIESALQTITTESNGPIETSSCRIVSSNPNIVAEMVFVEKAMADAVIKTFNGQKADGRILNVRHKGAAPVSDEPDFVSDPKPSAGKDLFDNSHATADGIATEAMEDVEMNAEPAVYSDERDRSDRERRDRDRDRDREPRREGDDDRDRDDRNGRRDDRDRDRDRDRERDRPRYDDRQYERRDDRGSSSRGYGPPSGFDQRGGRPYGNGMGGGYPRGGGYNDGIMGGPRGGFRGGPYRGGYGGRGRGY